MKIPQEFHKGDFLRRMERLAREGTTANFRNRGKGQLSEGHLFNSLECTDVSFAALIPK